jgi:hypothetical protein
MKPILVLFLIMAIFGVSVFAQNIKPKTPALPADIAEWNGEDSDKILNNAVIKTRLKKLLGKKNYAAFLDSFETLTPIEKNGDVLFSSGCLIHACTQLESAIVIDLVNKTIHAGVFRRNEKTKYFNEKGRKPPKLLKSWADRLEALK